MLKVISIICIILLIGMLLVAIESLIECSKHRITKYTLKSSKIKDKLKIVMMADLHNCNYKDGNKKILDTIKDEKPDVIILAGDMIVSHVDQEQENKKTSEFIKNMADIAPVYYGVGNHEKRAIISEKNLKPLWKSYLSDISSSDNIHLLRNNKKNILINSTPLSIKGIDMDIDYYKRFIEKKLSKEDIVAMVGEIEEDNFNILIAHNPDYFEIYSEYGADLICSGHNHGGLMRLPLLGGVISPRLRLFPKYDYGIYSKNKSNMVLTGGLGAHSMKIRVNNIPEIVVIDIIKE